MLAILLKILSVLGILLLVLLGILLIVLLLVLFFPITYRIYGRKDAETVAARVKVNWLLGLLRVRFVYPQPGKVLVKLLCFTLYDSKKKQAPSENAAQSKSEPSGNNSSNENTSASHDADLTQNAATGQTDGTEHGNTVHNGAEHGGTGHDGTEHGSENAASDAEGNSETKELSFFPKIKQLIFEKYKKIKYTIIKIYDKIKDILENLAFYKELFQEEDTKALLRHAKLRIGRILKRLRPRKLKADITFGTGSPDTTGYVLGIYGIFSPQIKKPCYVNLTPDFTQAVLEGEIDAAGHITVFCILSNGILLLLDKRLRMLIRRIKKHNAAQNVA